LPWLLATIASALMASIGCVRGPSDAADSSTADAAPPVPVKGVVRLEGRPLSGAVVTFLPPRGASYVGETDEAGRYVIEGAGSEGAPPGEYKVAVSYLVSAEGEPQRLASRSSLTGTPGMLTAKEQVARKFSDLGRSELKAVVGPQGGTFDFDVTREVPNPQEAKPREP